MEKEITDLASAIDPANVFEAQNFSWEVSGYKNSSDQKVSHTVRLNAISGSNTKNATQLEGSTESTSPGVVRGRLTFVKPCIVNLTFPFSSWETSGANDTGAWITVTINDERYFYKHISPGTSIARPQSIVWTKKRVEVGEYIEIKVSNFSYATLGVGCGVSGTRGLLQGILLE